jgi:hypothetical protein
MWATAPRQFFGPVVVGERTVVDRQPYSLQNPGN